MQVTSLLTRKDCLEPRAESAGTEHALRQLRVVFIGLILITSAYAVEWFSARNAAVAALCSLAGAVLLSAPILWNSFLDLRRGVVSINELVSLAVLASFMTGDYKTAGVVSFFMLVGEIIETRTAAGARASIESLIKLTPTRARRVNADGSEVEVATKDLAATGLQKPFIHEFIHRLARLESGVQLNQRVGPQRTRSEATIDKIAQTRLRYRDEARNVAAIIIDESIAEVEDVHRWKRKKVILSGV